MFTLSALRVNLTWKPVGSAGSCSLRLLVFRLFLHVQATARGHSRMIDSLHLCTCLMTRMVTRDCFVASIRWRPWRPIVPSCTYKLTLSALRVHTNISKIGVRAQQTKYTPTYVVEEISSRLCQDKALYGVVVVVDFSSLVFRGTGCFLFGTFATHETKQIFHGSGSAMHRIGQRLFHGVPVW